MNTKPRRRMAKSVRYGSVGLGALVAGIIGIRGGDSGGPVTEVALPAPGGGLEIEKKPGGWRIELDSELPRADNGRWYEAFVDGGPAGRVSVGTFNEGDDVTLWAGVPLTEYDTFVIVEQPAGREVTSAELDRAG